VDVQRCSLKPNSNNKGNYAGVIEAPEGRDVGTCDILNAFVQTELNERAQLVIEPSSKMRGPLVDILIEMNLNMRSLWLQEGMKLYYMLQ